MSNNPNPEYYLVRRPRYNSAGVVEGNRVMTWLSREQIAEANCSLELAWIKSPPGPRLQIGQHTHSCDEIVIFWGSNYRQPQVLGAEIEYLIGGQPIRFNTTTSLFIPKGVPHGPLKWTQFEQPHIQMSLLIGAGEREEATRQVEQALIPANPDFDYEQYVIRSPIREAGAEFVRGRTAPTLTYMSALQIPGTKNYIEFGWTFDMPLSQRAGSGMPSMAHRNYDEIVLHIGGDPDRPEVLGGDIEFWVADSALRFDTSSLLFVPKGLKHGPIKCLKYEFPHIVMAIMLGAGSVKEGWEGSFAPG
jgi:hypothetical protein